MGNMTTLQILQGVHDWVLDKIDEETANFITKTVNDLVNYYTKSETYTKVEVQQIVDAIKQFTYEVVQVLPTASASTMNKIYLVPAPKSEDKNVKEEYITIQDGSTYSWEMLGTTSIDLSNYYTKGQTDSAISSALSSALASYTTTADLTTLLAQKQDVIQDLATIRSGASAGSTAVQPSELSAYFNDASYDSNAHRINFYHGQTVVAYIDASPFIIDGMVKPVKATYEEMTEMRSQGKLIPGQYYQITDYVTTVNGATITDARSAGHPFDILVRADSVSTLNEQAWAVRHDGDTYFKDARLEAWQLKYRIDNVQWSKQAGTYVTDEDNGYTFHVIGDITLSGHTYKLLQGFGMYIEDWSDYALMDTVAEGEQIICYYGDPEEFDPEEPEVVGTASGVEELTEAGKGTITWMKDEHGNECPYDFKNVQFKRYMATDSVSGREGLGGKYMVADHDNCPQGLSVEDTEDFIWAYTFSSDNSGGEQTDYSLTAEHQVHDNVMKPYSGGLNNNVMFGSYIYGNEFEIDCYDNSIGSDMNNNSIGSKFQRNSIGSNMYYNSIGSSMYNNSIGSDMNNNSIGSVFSGNSIGSSFTYNSIGSSFRNNSIGSVFSGNSIGSSFTYNSIGSSFQQNIIGSSFTYNSIGSSMYNNSIGSSFTYNSIGSRYQYNTVDECVQHTTTGDNIKYVHVLNGVAGTSSSKLTLTFAANKTYCQMAAKTTAGVLKIWVPADLV